MNSRFFLWIVPLGIYAVFTFWYTDFRGPLSSGEIEDYMQKIKTRGLNEEALQSMERFMREDTGRQFIMVNVLDLHDDPGNVEGAEPGESAQQLMDRYMSYMFPALLSRASHPAFMGESINRSMDLVGIEGAEHWDSGALMRYRSRRTLMEIVANNDQADAHRYKVAALEKTIAYPVETRIYLSDLRFLLALILLCITALLDIAIYGRRASG